MTDRTDQGAGNVTPFSNEDTRTETQMYEEAQRRQDEIDVREYGETHQRIEKYIKKVMGSREQETPTHWGDGSAKTPSELRITEICRRQERIKKLWEKSQRKEPAPPPGG